MKAKSDRLYYVMEKYETKKKALSISAKCIDDKYYVYIAKKYKKLINMTISISDYGMDLFKDFINEKPIEERSKMIKEMIDFGLSLLDNVPKMPIFDNRSEFIMFFMRYYYITHIDKGTEEIKETDDYILIDGKKYKKNGKA